MSDRNPGGDLLQAFLTEKNLTHEEAAKVLGVTRSLVTLWINGHVRPKLKTRRDIAAWTSGGVPEGAWERPQDQPTVQPLDAAESESGGTPAATFPADGENPVRGAASSG